MPDNLPKVRSPRAYGWLAVAIAHVTLAASEFAGQEHMQHEAAADSILDQLTELYKAVTK